MSSFFKRLFGGGNAAAAPQVEEDPIAVARARAARLNPRTQPLDWAEAMQTLGHSLMTVAGADVALYAEAERTLEQAHGAAATGHPLFRASILKWLGETRYRHGERLTADARGFKLAEAANTLAEAMELVQPHENRALWVEAAIFRGAALHELGRLSPGPEGLSWMDQAAACFGEIARHGSEDGLNPIGLYNRFSVLEQRGHRTEGATRAAIYREARAALAAAMSHQTFADRPDLSVKLAELDALIAVAD